MAKELIFNIEDGKPVFDVVMWALDGETMDLVLMPILQIIEGDDDDVKRTLAYASISEVPVYPNTTDVAPELVRYQRSLMAEGFRASDDEGGARRLALTRYRGSAEDEHRLIEDLAELDLLTPPEVLMLREALTEQQRQRSEAEYLLAALRAGTADLEALLANDAAPEEDLQRCLTRNPLLFGPDYRNVLPKHRLGSDFVMDYALERLSGFVDLIEIEKSHYRLFTKAGNPTKELVHAEQQVLDWLDWLEEHASYARKDLPGVLRPVGYVVIGRSTQLDQKAIRRLKRRNAAFRDAVQIMTYDDLLQRAKNLFAALTTSVRDEAE